LREENRLQKYLAKIKSEYDTLLTEENYKDMILEELESPPSLLDYFKEYMTRNKDIITLEWGCLFFLFIKAEQQKDVSDIKRYYKLLEKYPVNWLTEVTMAELELRYYGNLFKARDGFRKALQLKPNDAYCHYSLGFIYYLLGVFDKSTEHYENAVIHHKSANRPGEVKARSLYNLAVHKINIKHDYKEAKKLLRRALREMPDYPQAKDALRQINERGWNEKNRRFFWQR